MAVTYVIDSNAQLVLMTATGPTSTSDIADVQRRLREDPHFQPTFNQLFDFRNATPTDVHNRQVEALLESSPSAPSSRRAYVVSPGVSYGMARMAAAMAEYQKRMVRVFLSMDAARAWVMTGEEPSA